MYSASSRDEDRAILIDLKAKGASRETFSALSEKLNKPSGQVGSSLFSFVSVMRYDNYVL